MYFLCFIRVKGAKKLDKFICHLLVLTASKFLEGGNFALLSKFREGII